MKRITAILSLAILATACNQTPVEGEINTETYTEEEVMSALTQGSFTVTNFVDDGEVENILQGYSFTFDANGSVTASGPEETILGEWELEIEEDGAELEIDFDEDEDELDELEDEWDIDKITDNTIELGDDDDEGSDADQVTFTRK